VTWFLTGIGRDWGSLVRCWGIRVDSSSLIGDISNIAFIAISLVVDMLGTAIRESNGVRSGSISSTITGLSSVESSLGVVISNSVGVGVRRGLIGISWLSMVSRGVVDNRGVVSGSSVDNRGVVDNWGVVGRGSMVDNWGMVSWGSMDNRGGMVSWGSVDNRGVVDNWGMVSRGSMVDNWGMVSWGSVDNGGGMVSWCCVDNRGVISRGSMDSMDNRGGMVSSTSNWSVSTICWLHLRETLRVVYLGDRGVSSTESLGLHNAPLFSIRPGHCLVRGLSTSIAKHGATGGSRGSSHKGR